MFEHFNELDEAVELMLEKSTTNVRAHTSAANMTQEEYDKHKDALEHHAGAINYYRNMPQVKEKLEHITKELVPLRTYVKKPLKLEGKTAPQIAEEDLDKEHPALKGRADLGELTNLVNAHLKQAHTAINQTPEIVLLRSHSKRLLAHLGSMLEWHNVQKKGEGAHHPFRGHISGPELEKQYDNSEYRGHSTPSAADSTKLRTQSITKGGGAKWHPGLPELTSLEEAHGHRSIGTMKKLYPFHDIKVNHTPINVKAFTAENPPEHMHDQDYATNLTKEHKVKYPDGSVSDAVGGWHGSKSIGSVLSSAEKKGLIKSSDQPSCIYFPKVTIARYVFAKNLIKAINPYAGMDDEMFGDYVAASLYKNLTESEQAAILAESMNRLEKAKKTGSSYNRTGMQTAHQEGVQSVLSGKITPLPRIEVPARTVKEGEKKNELQSLEYRKGERKRSPYVAPAHVFTDETYTKIDPEKYKKWVHEPATDEDLRAETASYGELVITNPQAQKAHQNFIDSFRGKGLAAKQAEPDNSKSKESFDREAHVNRMNELYQSGKGGTPEYKQLVNKLREHDEPGQGAEAEEAPFNHKEHLKQLSQMHASGKINAQEYASMASEAAKKAAAQRSGKVAQSSLSPEQKEIKEADPSYQPRRAGKEEAAAQQSEKDLTSIAQGKIPAHMLADENMFGEQDEFSQARAQEVVGGKKGKSGEDEGVSSGSTTAKPSAVSFVNEHPGFKAYLKMKDHLLSHYKDPTVRKYMEDKIAQHESQPDIDPAKLAGLFHVMNRARERATKSSKGQERLLQDIARAPEAEGSPAQAAQEAQSKGTAEVPETMMTPEQITRLQEARKQKGTSAMSQEDFKAKGASVPTTSDPEYKKKLMAEYQAREEAKRAKK